MNEIVEPGNSTTPEATTEPVTPSTILETTLTTEPAAEPAKSLVNEETPKDDLTTVPAEVITLENITLPEGITIDEPVMGSFLEIMNNAELTAQERVQKLVDLQSEVQRAAAEEPGKVWEETQDGWRREAEAHPVIGGNKLAGTLQGVSKLIESYGGDATEQKALRQVMDFTGAGNNPHVIAFLSRVAGKLVVEGGPVIGSPTSEASGASLAQRMFPNSP